MSSSEIDRIISKYDKRQPPYHFEIQSTKRKTDNKNKEDHVITFMNESLTPSKQMNCYSALTDRSHGSRNMQHYEAKTALKHLDDTQNRLAISERNYAEMCRKFENLRIYNEKIEQQLQKQRKSRLQELLDLQNRLILMETEHNNKIGIIKNKDDCIAILNEKLLQKDEQISIFQQELEQISYRLHSTIQLKQEEKNQKYIAAKRQQENLSISMLLKLKESHQKQMELLKCQISKYKDILAQKDKQKKLLAQKLQQASNYNIGQINQLKNALRNSQEESRKYLNDLKRQKIELTENYQSQIRQLKRKQADGHNYQTQKKFETISTQKQLLRDYEEKVKQLQDANYEKEKLIQNLAQQVKDDQHRIHNLDQKVEKLKRQYVDQLKQTKKYLAGMQQYEQSCQKQKQNAKKILLQSQRYKRCVENLQRQMKILQDQNQQIKAKLIEIRKVKRSNSTALQEINMNKNLTETATKQHQKIQKLHQQVQNLTTQLYAERLQNAKLKQQIQSTQKQLKRQYELSLQNIKEQLSEKIKNNKNINQSFDISKQDIYLEIFGLQRKYQLLKSQTITVQEMARMTGKCQRFHSKKKL